MASMVIGLIISFFLAGMGIAYAGNIFQGIGVFLIWLIVSIIAMFTSGMLATILGVFAFLIWAYGLYTTFVLTSKNAS